MAHVQKFTISEVSNLLRHNTRNVAHSSNLDIDLERSHLNVSLLEPRSISDYDYFLQRKSELYCYNRKDVKVAVGWVVTAPEDLQKDQEEQFFQATSAFLQDRYGIDNTLQSIVHYDEGGRPHLHFVFIPVAPDLKYGGEKICANDVLNPKELRCFHPALQKYLNAAGIRCKVVTGITQEIGGNISVRDLKRAEKLIERKRGFTW